MDDAFSLNSSLLSPAKARQAAIQAKDWAYINSWLSSKYSPSPVPPFERNEDTLKILLAIAAANDSVDEEATLLHYAREDVLRGYKARERCEIALKGELLENLEAHLDEQGLKSLDDLAETTVTLAALSTDPAAISQLIIELTKEEFDVAEQVRKTEALQSYLDKESDAVRNQIEELKANEAYEMSPNLPDQVAEWSRNTKLLVAKVEEYRDRITAFQRSVNIKGPTIEELMVEEENVVRIKETVKTLEGRIRMFHGLPADIQGAKSEYKQLECELHQLTQQRDKMFEGLMNKR
jgi:HAUS augmin-like complex subunit 1